jgi:hypothetical protein
MKNQKGEVITGVIIVVVVGVMLFSTFFMHGGHGDHKDHRMGDQQCNSGTTQYHMHQSDAEKAQQIAADERK